MLNSLRIKLLAVSAAVLGFSGLALAGDIAIVECRADENGAFIVSASSFSAKNDVKVTANDNCAQTLQNLDAANFYMKETSALNNSVVYTLEHDTSK